MLLKNHCVVCKESSRQGEHCITVQLHHPGAVTAISLGCKFADNKLANRLFARCKTKIPVYKIILTEIAIVESGMRSYLKIHRFLAGILYAPFHNKSVVLKTVRCLQTERVRIYLERLGIGLKAKHYALLVLAQHLELAVTGKTVLRQVVGLVPYPVFPVPNLAHYGKEHGCMSAPVFLIGRPYQLFGTALFFKACKFGSLQVYAGRQQFIL